MYVFIWLFAYFIARKVVEKQALMPVEEDKREHYNQEAAKYWDEFYTHHSNQFFKDR